MMLDWHPVPQVRALFTTRGGGVSTGPWASLNLGDHVGDAPAAVAENRRRLGVLATLPGEPRWLRQVHGIGVADLDAKATGVAEADAAVTTRVGTVCVVLTADCLPVLLAARDGSCVGAVHAGWRGLAAGVIEAGVQAMRQRMAPGIDLLAFLGPAISAAHFEVGSEVRAAFLAADAHADPAFVAQSNGRWHCDLFQLARQRLARLGIEAVAGGGLCTYADAGRFFSHRRDVQHRGLDSTGRMAALIWRTA